MDIQEEKRLRALRSYNILDSKAEKAFDNLTKLAAQICGTSVSQINFLSKNRQWSKASTGWGETELPREVGFCKHTIQFQDLCMVVEDTLQDERFIDNPLVKKDPPIRFYAGITIKSEDDYPLGALCVYDSEPKQLTDQQLESLRILADEVETHLKLRVNQDQLKERLIQENKFNQRVIESLPNMFFMYTKRGEALLWNKHLERTTGYSDQEIKQMQPEDYFENEDQKLVLQKMDQVFKGGQVLFEANITAKDGSSIPFIFSASSFEMNNETYLIGTGQDISEQKEIQHKLEQSLKEKNVLLAELHHRVKNNLAVISGIIELETLQDEVADSEKRLINTILRIKTMAQVHEVMYQMENLTHVAFDEVVKTIAENVKNTYSSSDNIVLTSNIDKIILNVNQAIPCGLIVNELLANAWKHAYPDGQEGLITLEMHDNDGNIELRIADEGQGLPKDVGLYTGHTIGFTFVKSFCSQLDAEININRESGTEYIIQFKKRELKGSSGSLNIQYN